MRMYLLVLLFIATIGCTVQKTICPCDAPSRMMVDGAELELTGEAEWLPSGKNMALTLRLSPVGLQQLIPEGVTAREYYIRPSDQRFDAARGEFEEQLFDSKSAIMLLRTVKAPPWPEGITIDIAVHFTDRTGKTFFLKVDGVTIER